MKSIKLLLLLALITTSISSFAADWSTTSVSYLRGNDFAELYGADPDRSELSFEHASGFSYGDQFLFVDVTDALKENDKDYEIYGEWSPRFSLGKIFKKYDDKRFIKDLLVAGTLEFGKSSVSSRAKLYGFALDFNVPYFAFLNYHIYLRDNIDVSGSTYQSTITHLLPIKISEKFQFEWGGYIDIVHGDESDVEAHWQTAQQLLVDAGAVIGKPGTIHAGIEYQYWNRKYGIKGGPVESNVKWMVKWIF